MDPLSNYLEGTCVLMCPEDELKMREERRLLHKFEILTGTEKQRKPKADRGRVVKCFSRSAAGQSLQIAKNLRTPQTLLKTVHYLLDDVVAMNSRHWYTVYGFVADRLRAVRQDMVVQNLSASYSISILEPISRYHAYSAYKLCIEAIANFDPVLNKQHLQECLKRLLVIYSCCDSMLEKCSKLNSSLVKEIDSHSFVELYKDSRPYIESLYMLLNLGDPHAITRGLNLPNEWRTSIVKTVLEISLVSCNGNWIRVCKLMKDLPALLAAVAAMKLPEIRRRAFLVMSAAYNSKNVTFPTETLKENLLYNSANDLVKDAHYYNIVADETKIQFQKAQTSVAKESVRPGHESFVEEKLKNKSIPSLVL